MTITAPRTPEQSLLFIDELSHDEIKQLQRDAATAFQLAPHFHDTLKGELLVQN